MSVQVGVELDPCSSSDGELMFIDPSEDPETLTDWDFPGHHVNRKHPLDYILADEPIVPEFIHHQSEYSNSYRLILQISWKAGDHYLTMTFLLDFNYKFNTQNICFFPEAYKALSDNDLIEEE
jgi:hypothetical protein